MHNIKSLNSWYFTVGLIHYVKKIPKQIVLFTKNLQNFYDLFKKKKTSLFYKL